MIEVPEQWASAVRAATQSGCPLRIRGGGTKDFYGHNCDGELLDTRAYAGIVDYEPSELVVTARCGTRLAELELVLAASGQMLAFEPPHFGADATVGGMVAAGLSGPRRQAAGALRDYVLGVKILDGNADILAFGGQVMKNVAGYDVSRLMAGSLGTLGIILEVSLKTQPVPVAQATLRFDLPEEKAVALLNRWHGRPLPVSASVWHDGDLSVRLSGAAAAVKAAVASLGGERMDDEQATHLWTSIREHTTPFFRVDVPLWRLSVPSSLPVDAIGLDRHGERLIEWGGALRWVAGHVDGRVLREAVAEVGGHATLFRGLDKTSGVFQALPPALMGIHRNIKSAFDPHGIFNAGRMYPGL